mmetsp:Transcript_81342/g.186063  ORF Transcript_81342/g.186063 Transcript_81342/m.186063 type:complete len:272 (+) Transcript_81342:42-857(+)
MGRSKVNKCCLCMTGCTSCVVVTFGVLLIAAANLLDDEIEKLDPHNDFVLLPEECTIQHVQIDKDASESCSGDSCTAVCTVTSNAEFLSDGTRYEAAETSVKYSGECEYVTSYALNGVSNGDKVPCWEPAVFPLPTLYKCGNQQCIKVISPVEEAERLERLQEATESVSRFGVLVILAGVAFCCFCCPYLWVRGQDQYTWRDIFASMGMLDKDNKTTSPVEVPPPPMAVAVPVAQAPARPPAPVQATVMGVVVQTTPVQASVVDNETPQQV